MNGNKAIPEEALGKLGVLSAHLVIIFPKRWELLAVKALCCGGGKAPSEFASELICIPILLSLPAAFHHKDHF